MREFKKNLYLFGILLIFLIFPSVFALDINSCQTISSSNTVYDLTQNVTSTGTCFTLSADNITIDCHDYEITFGTSGSGYGIYTTGRGNITIKNCKILDGDYTNSSTGRRGITFNIGTSNSLIENCLINTSYDRGIYLITNSNITLKNSILYSNNYISFAGLTSNNLKIYNNSIYSSVTTTAALYFSLVNNSNVSNNQVNLFSSVGSAMRLDNSSNNLIHDNTLISSSGTGIYFYISCLNNTVSKNNITGNYAVNFRQASSNNIVKDCLYLSGSTYDIYLLNLPGSVNNTVLNCSYNISKEAIFASDGEIIRKWYYKANASLVNGTVLDSANVSAWNSTGSLQFTALTNSSGYIETQELIDYVNIGGTRTYYSSYTINATKTGYSTISKIYNVTSSLNKLDDVLRDDVVTFCKSLDVENQTYFLENNVLSNTTCFTITANNVTLNCQGYNITYGINGENSARGITSTLFNFTTVKNCKINDGNNSGVGKHNILFTGENGLIENNTLFANSSTTHNIQISGRNHTVFSNNLMNYNNTGGSYGLYLYSSYSNITFNNFSTAGYSIRIVQAMNSIIENNNMNSTSQALFFSTTPGENITLSRNKIISTSYAIWIYINGYNFSVFDSFHNGGYDYNVYTSGVFGIHNFTNVTRLDGSKIIRNWVSPSTTTFNYAWWLALTIKNNAGEAMNNSNVSIYDKNNNLVYSGLTNSTGQIPRQSILEFTQTNNTAINYYSNYTINVISASSDFSNITYLLNMSTNKEITLTSNDLIFPLISYESPTPENNSGVSSSFTINSSIYDKYLSNITYNWNGTNNTIYSKFRVLDDAILILNFDNLSEYGENDTIVKDFSRNNLTLALSGGVPNLTLGKYGLSENFNRSQYLSINNLGFESEDEVITYSFWYKAKNESFISSIFADGTQLGCSEGGNFSWIYRNINSNSFIIQYCNENITRSDLTTSTNFFEGYDNQWVHVVLSVDYKNNQLKYYRNGEYLGLDVSSYDMIFSNGIRTKYIGGYTSTSHKLNGSLDEFLIFNRSLTDDEVKFLYSSQVKRFEGVSSTNYISNGNFSNASFSLETNNFENYSLEVNQSGLAVGQSYTYFLTATDLATNSNSTEIRSLAGNSLPSVNNLTTTPSGLNDIDPETLITITVNITDDDQNYNYSIFQWFNSSSNDWVNITMNNLTAKGRYTLLNASFISPSTEQNLTYRIFSYDEIGSEVSSNYTLENFWDCSFEITPTELEETIGYFEDKTLGNVTISNLGDSNYSGGCIIKFTTSYTGFTNLGVWGDSSKWVSNNRGIQLPLTLTLMTNTSEIILVNASFPSTDSPFIEIPTITITSNVTDTIDAETNVSIGTTLITSQPNPLLYQEIISSPTLIWLTPQTFNLTSSIRNLGGDNTDNNTAYNVSFNWTLPPVISSRISSGNTTIFYNSLSNSSKEFNNLTIELTGSNLASMSKGTQNISLYSYGYKNESGNLTLIINGDNETILRDTASIQFACYSEIDLICVTSCGVGVDPDCVASTSSGGSGGGGGGSSGTQEKSEAEYELLRGKESDFTLEIKNKYEGDIRNLRISVLGIDSSLIEIIPSEISLLEVGQSANITARITAPAYFVEGKYILQFIISGEILQEKGVVSYTERRKVDLYIIDLPKSETELLVNQSISMIEEMKNLNLSLSNLEELFNSMNESFNNKRFSEVKLTYEEIKSVYDNAKESLSLIEELREGIFDAEKRGISVLETKKMLYIAEVAFTRGDYNLALERLKEAKLTYALETKGEFNIIYAVKNNPFESIGILLAGIFVSVSSTLITRFKLYKRKLKLLSEEEKLLLELMKVVQRETFEKNHFSMEEYEQAMYQYEDRLSKIVEEKISIETKLANMLNVRGKEKALTEEKKRLVELVKKVQDEYLNKRKLETRIYENMVKSYSNRLAEVEEELTFIEAEEAFGKKSFFKKLFKLRRKRK